MLVMGGDLKRREKLSARLGDILSLMYLSSATLKRYEAEGRQAEDAPLMHWAIWDAMFKAQSAFEGVIANYPNRLAAALLRWFIFPIGRPYFASSDKLGHEVAKRLIEPGATRDRLTGGMYVPRDENDALGVIDLALEATVAAEAVDAKIRAARKAGKITSRDEALAERHALEAGIITAEEMALLERRRVLRDKVIRVDDFPQDFGVGEIRQASSLRVAA
jgi:acyl-CoA dehydrogenase